ncbi:MAG: ABC transporter ATP-binding protein [Lachnospiraceae bacterium]|nr:ABC transporter ATP-binding protein [Lachnospiraceae bacterium]MEE3461771.1 ABC transporter ATP-binding protein [Lachnospiraceae bacterium]
MNNDTKISIKDLSKVYNMKGTRVNALDHVNLDIEGGKFVSVIGKSGSGKSTLLHMIGGLDKATSGSIFIDGEDITKYKEKKLTKYRSQKIGFVFQKFCLVPELNVYENIVLPILLAKKKVDRDRIMEIAEKLELKDRLKHKPAELSGGQQQRTAIARALANDPEILLCDEPTGNLDKKTSEEVIDLLVHLNRYTKKTLLIVTHDNDIASKADITYEIVDGKAGLKA